MELVEGSSLADHLTSLAEKNRGCMPEGDIWQVRDTSYQTNGHAAYGHIACGHGGPPWCLLDGVHCVL